MSERTVCIGNGHVFVTLDAVGQARDLYHPFAGFPNHLSAGGCSMGVQLDDLTGTSWVDGSWASTQVVDWDGRGCHTSLRMPDHLVQLTISDRLGATSKCWRRTIAVTSEAPLSARILLHHDARLGGTDIGACVRHHPDSHILHFNRDQYLKISIDDAAISDWTLGRADECDGAGIKGHVTRGSLGRNRVAMGATESIVAQAVELTSGDATTFTLRLAFGATSADADRAHGADEAEFKVSPLPEILRSISTKLQPLASTSLAMLLAHVDSEGGIVAGLDGSQTPSSRDGYSYVWMRDAALIADVLGRVGRGDLVWALTRFATRAMSDSGYLGQRHHPDGSPGSTWHPEPIEGDGVLPIQTDETALCVWMTVRQIERDGCEGDVNCVFRDLIAPMANFLVTYRDSETGLPLPSHDLWEERFGIHTFTAMATVSALHHAARLALQIGQASRGKAWQDAAEAMEAAIQRRLFHKDLGRFARCATLQADGSLFLDTTPDASCFLCVLVRPEALDDDKWQRTTRSVQEAIKVDETKGGMARYVGDDYARSPQLDEGIAGNPWPMVTCWQAEIDSLAKRKKQAIGHLRSVSNMTTRGNTLPEQIDPLTGRPASITPLPWSHAAFLSAVLQLRE